MIMMMMIPMYISGMMIALMLMLLMFIVQKRSPLQTALLADTHLHTGDVDDIYGPYNEVNE